MTSTLPASRRVVVSLESRARVVSNAEVQSSSTAASSREVLPTVQFARERSIIPTWFNSAARRVLELAQLRKGWDSYDGKPLQLESVAGFTWVIREYGRAIQTEPMISLNGDGGLILEW